MPCKLLCLVLLLNSYADAAQLTVRPGAVNGVLIQGDTAHVAVYGWDGTEAPDAVLLTHGRRDVIWKSEQNIEAGAAVIAPLAERFTLEKAADYWESFPQTRYHDYAQQSTKISPEPVSVDRWVQAGDKLNWPGIELRVIATPGYTRGSVSYLADIDGQRVAFTGDLIFDGGRIVDLYSFQDAIPEAQIRGYHGYGARLADLVVSLQQLAMEQPDLIVPARGPVISNPEEAITNLISRVRALYQNYLSTNALHWYFKEERMKLCGKRVLGADLPVELMPYSHHENTPDWIFERGTSRLLISDSGSGFLLDCGNQTVIDTIQKLIDDAVITGIDGIFVTHYHDDHTDSVQAAAETFQCPVYATEEYADVLKRPSAFHLPAMTANPVHNVTAVSDGHQIKWHEFDLTFRFFPGQTWYHGALFVRKPEQRPVFFIGDAFAPSGLDDYCLLNRNLVSEDSGYLYCLKMLRSIKEPYWLVNEHIPYVFSFTDEELTYLEQRYRERIQILRRLFPWDDPNYGVDEQWAVIYPRGASAREGQFVDLQLRVTNHSPQDRAFRFRLNLPPGITAESGPGPLQLRAGQTGHSVFRVKVEDGGSAARQTRVISADIATAGMEFRRWADALLTIEQP